MWELPRNSSKNGKTQTELLDRDSRSDFLVDMNQKTAKLLNKYAELKGVSSKQIKREWLVLNEHQKDQKRQEILKELVK